jgi:hypothetical protein
MAWMQGHGARGALLSLFSCACLEATSSANSVPRCPAAVAVGAEPVDTPALPAPTAVDGVIAALPAEAAPEGGIVTSTPASHLERLDVIPALPPPDPGAPSMSPVAEREPGRLVWLRAREAMGLLAIDPTESPYKPNVPREYTTCGPFGSTLQICVSEAGDVTGMQILRPSIPILDLQLERVIYRWRYTPYRVDGRPTPFCYALRYTVR